MNDSMYVTRPNWSEVARIVSARLGKPYSATYVQNISAGVRTQHQIAPILRELGVMKDQASDSLLAEQSTPTNNPRLLRQRRILAKHVADLKRDIAHRDASICEYRNILKDRSEVIQSQRVSLESAHELAAELRAQLDVLHAKNNRLSADRTAAVARAISAEDRAAQADRMLSQILNDFRTPITIRRTGTWLDLFLGFLFRLSPKEARA